jgi:hypothetical protein
MSTGKTSTSPAAKPRKVHPAPDVCAAVDAVCDGTAVCEAPGRVVAGCGVVGRMVAA